MRVVLVVPCYNEEKRLPEAQYVQWLGAGESSVHLLFVDDGSRDGTVKLLRRIAQSVPAGRASILELGTNQGKAEAVRRGFLEAMSSASDGDLVGFWDSDLATPLAAVAQLAGVLRERPQLQMVFGARVALLGRAISRSPVRHYLGRVFATLASAILDLAIYDTQCGSKLFRVTPALRAVVGTPFLTRWVFDCEMIARYAALSAAGAAPSTLPLTETIYEFPLEEWVDVAGSKVKPTDIIRMAIGLVRIRLVYFLHEWPSGKPKLRQLGTMLVVLIVAALSGLLLIFAFGSALLGTLSGC
jgi:dolichyl-phosphate beta-glucosyltransferase